MSDDQFERIEHGDDAVTPLAPREDIPLTPNDRAMLSIAISLKRLADAADVIEDMMFSDASARARFAESLKETGDIMRLALSETTNLDS